MQRGYVTVAGMTCIAEFMDLKVPGEQSELSVVRGAG